MYAWTVYIIFNIHAWCKIKALLTLKTFLKTLLVYQPGENIFLRVFQIFRENCSEIFQNFLEISIVSVRSIKKSEIFLGSIFLSFEFHSFSPYRFSEFLWLILIFCSSSTMHKYSVLHWAHGIRLRRGSTPSLSHTFVRRVASVAPMWFSIVLSLALRISFSVSIFYRYKYCTCYKR